MVVQIKTGCLNMFLTLILLSNPEGQRVTTSLLIAEKFHKSHGKVLQGIDKLPCSQSFRDLNFQETTYLDKQSKEKRLIEMTRDGFYLLAFGFNGKGAGEWKEKFLATFNQVVELAISQDAILSNRDLTIKRTFEIPISLIKFKHPSSCHLLWKYEPHKSSLHRPLVRGTIHCAEYRS